MKRLYVLTRKDLDPIYKMVQGSHALAQFALEQEPSFKTWNNDYLIFLEVKDKQALVKEITKLEEQQIPYSLFYEPDISDHTAAACFVDQTIFQHLKTATK